ncbi:MAG: SLBB domain-containing protein [Ginsengibacter sp.]
MKIIKISFFFLITLLFSATKISAQVNFLNNSDLSNVSVGNYSDEEISEVYNKALQTGISETQFYKMVADRGMAASEIAKLQARLQSIKDRVRSNASREVADTNKNNSGHRYDSSGTSVPLQKFNNDPAIFGSELFTANSMVFEPNLRIPAPAGYILGPDDEVVISIYGFSEKKYNLKINERGEIYIPNVGPLFLNGLTLEEARTKISSKLASTIYRAISSGQTKVQVTLGEIRSIRVTVIGQAKKPGTYTISSLTTLYNLLYLCGGPTDMGSYRKIEVIRGNDKRIADLYDFLVQGSQKGNILLQEGDVVRIPYYDIRVTISGNVKRVGKFEMLANEKFSDLLNYSGGFTDNAYRGAVTVERITDTERKIIDLVAGQYNSFIVMGSDRYIVKRLQEEFGNRVEISGSVLRPGPFELSTGMSVTDLLQKAGGLTVDAYTRRVSIFRYFTNKVPTVVSINLDSILNNNVQVPLQKNDSVAIHSIFDFKDNAFVVIQGEVRKPGNIIWRENLSLRDVILNAGGINNFGDSTNIEISRRILSANTNQVNHDESQVFSVNLKDPNNHEDVILQPYDIIFIKNKSGYTIQRSVLVVGEVKSPGRYGLIKSGDRISDVIKRTGGFKASADSSSLTIRRSVKNTLTTSEREKLFQRILNIDSDSLAQDSRLKDELYKSYDLISINLKQALQYPARSENLALEDGDVLTVERSTNLVKVSGEVYFPTIIPYKKGENLKYYVQQAGNFMPSARKTGALVIQPDGKAQSVKHFLWFKFYPEVTPRSEIFVPQKMKNNRTKLGVGEMALIVSALGIVASAIKF